MTSTRKTTGEIEYSPSSVPTMHKAALPLQASNLESSRFTNDKQPLRSSKRAIPAAARKGDVSNKSTRIPAPSRAIQLENSCYSADSKRTPVKASNQSSNSISVCPLTPPTPPPITTTSTQRTSSPKSKPRKACPYHWKHDNCVWGRNSAGCLIGDHSHPREYEAFAFDKRARNPCFYLHNQMSVLMNLEWDYGDIRIREDEICTAWRIWRVEESAAGEWEFEGLVDR